MKPWTGLALSLALSVGVNRAAAQIAAPPVEPPSGPSDATIDLATAAGVAQVQGQWRYSDARIVETEFRGPGRDLQPTGDVVKTHDIEPHAGRAEFDDSAWVRIDATTLADR